MEGGGVGGRGCWPCPIIVSGTVTAWRADLAAVFNFRGALSWWFAGGSASSAPMMAVVGLLCCALIIYVWCSIPSSLLRPAEVARGEGGGCGRSVLVVGLQVVFFFGDSAPAGLGGEGSGFCRSLGDAAGGPRRCCVGWKLGGVGERMPWPCSISDLLFRRSAADDSCGCLLHVVAPLRRRLVVRRRLRRLGFLGEWWWI